MTTKENTVPEQIPAAELAYGRSWRVPHKRVDYSNNL